MLVIKKGKSKMKVAKSAYNNFYKGAGWEIDDEVSSVVYSSESDEKLGNDSNEDDEWAGYEDEDPTEKDLSEMSHAELKEKAESLGIDTTGMNTKQLRAKLKSLS